MTNAAGRLDPDRWALVTDGRAHLRATDLSECVDVHEVADDVFAATCHDGSPGRLFGGQVAAQATVAAGRTVAAAALHAVHADFLRPGRSAQPVTYTVHRIRDSRAFHSRRVEATQGGRTILELTASFHGPETGPEVLPAIPDVGPPDGLRSFTAGPVELRVVPSAEDVLRVWLRATRPMPDDPLLQAAGLVYATDLTMTGAVQYARGEQPFGPWPLHSASLDHSVHLHGELRMNGWLLHDHASALATAGRGQAHGRVFARSGALVATTSQQMLLRPVTADRDLS